MFSCVHRKKEYGRDIISHSNTRIFGNFKQREQTYDLRDKNLLDSDSVISVAMTLGYAGRVQFIAQNNVEMILYGRNVMGHCASIGHKLHVSSYM